MDIGSDARRVDVKLPFMTRGNRQQRHETKGRVNKMSDDLISRKALKNEIIEYRKQFPIGSSERILVSTVIGFINTAPKAFDKEKVKSQIQNAIELAVSDPLFHGRYIKKQMALEIVEKGGIE